MEIGELDPAFFLCEECGGPAGDCRCIERGMFLDIEGERMEQEEWPEPAQPGGRGGCLKMVCVCGKESDSELNRWNRWYVTSGEIWLERCSACGRQWSVEMKAKRAP